MFTLNDIKGQEKSFNENNFGSSFTWTQRSRHLSTVGGWFTEGPAGGPGSSKTTEEPRVGTLVHLSSTGSRNPSDFSKGHPLSRSDRGVTLSVEIKP